MKKDKRNVLIFIVIMFLVVAISYFMYLLNVPSKFESYFKNMRASVNKNINASDRPIITEIVNSSGGNMVNTDVVITINATSKYNISKIEYSYDLKSWKNINETFDKKQTSVKLIFTKTMDKKIYFRVTNSYGYKSYAYETTIKIDKMLPSIDLIFDDKDVLINAKDNAGLFSLQYSNDKLNWDEEVLIAEDITIRKPRFDYKYVRAIDVNGNISDIKIIW